MTALRLFSPEGGGERLGDADLTLPLFFERHVAQGVLVGNSAESLKDIRGSLNYWRTYSGDPVLRELDTGQENDRGRLVYPGAREAVARFRQGMLTKARYRGKPLAENTIRKHIGNIQFVLNQTGPRTRRYPDAFDLLAEVPLITKPPKVTNDVESDFTLSEISQWLEVCRFAKRPMLGVLPRAWWQNLIIFAYNTGLRIYTIARLRFDWLIENELGAWVQIPTDSAKKKRGRAYYLNQAARDCVAAMPRFRPEIFAWPHGRNYLQKYRRRLIDLTNLPRNRRFGFHGLRRAFTNQLIRINPLIVPQALGHSGNVTLDHYTHKRHMCEAMDQLPQPKWDREREGSQLLLF